MTTALYVIAAILLASLVVAVRHIFRTEWKLACTQDDLTASDRLVAALLRENVHPTGSIEAIVATHPAARKTLHHLQERVK